MAKQGKFGWYPCDIETYHKLKAINFAFDQAVHKMKAWERWDRKDVKNRVVRKKLKDSTGRVVGYGLAEPMPEPPLCPIFFKKAVKLVNFQNGVYYKAGIEKTFVEMSQGSVYDDYRKARYPVSTEAEVQSFNISLEKINELYLAIKHK